MATETSPTRSSVSTATQVQTVAEVKPVEVLAVEKVADKNEPQKTASELRAWFECDSVPDGSKMTPHRLFTQSWTIRNPGPDAWPAGCAVCFTGGDQMLNVDTKNPSSVTALAAATKSNAATKIEPGELAAFDVLLKSPEREGRAISYWRLKTAEGIPFGHKLWVDITVSALPVDTTTQDQPEAAEVAEKEVQYEDMKDEEVKKEESSIMVFPKLEKESPVSSVHGLATSTEAEESKVKVEDEELVEELESLGFEDEDETDDGFLTDEEYDILDASDEDLLTDAHAADQK